MRLFKNFGRLPQTWLNLVLIVAAGIAEGLGLTLFVPLLELMTGSTSETSGRLFGFYRDLFAYSGVSYSLTSVLFLTAALVLGSLGLGFIQRYLLVRSRHLYVRDIRERIMKGMFGSTWDHISQMAHGDVVNRVIVETNRAGSALQFEIFCIGSMIQIVLFLAFSSLISWPLLLITLVFGAAANRIVRPNQVRSRVLGQEITKANSNLSFHIVDFLRGAKLIKATATEPGILSRLNEFNQTYFSINFQADVNLARIYYVVQALPVVLLVIIILVSHSALDIEPAFTLAFLLILSRIAPRLAQFEQYHQGFNINFPGVATVDDFLAKGACHNEAAESGGKTFDRLHKEIRFESVSLKFPSAQNPAVSDIDLVVEKGSIVALVGRSGAGKSTLVDLLCGLRRPDSGRILVDGEDMAAIDIFSWRRKIGYVMQDVTVFNDSLRNNLLFVNPDATDDDLHQAIRMALLEDVVSALPQGMDTILGEGGVTLSGGQRQRLALARALVGNPDLLILDEATSSLDSESEQLIQEAIDAIAHTVTIVIVAHRLSTVRRANCIHVLDGGHIVERGTYDDLLRQAGRFAELHHQQFA